MRLGLSRDGLRQVSKGLHIPKNVIVDFMLALGSSLLQALWDGALNTPTLPLHAHGYALLSKKELKPKNLALSRMMGPMSGMVNVG